MPSHSTSSNQGTVITKKRRKIRKGTTSCWECKRRKVRCSLVDGPGGVCKACQRRGTKCLTQDYPVEDEVEHAPGGWRMAGVPEPSSPAAADSPGVGQRSPSQRIIADSERDRRSISTSLAVCRDPAVLSLVVLLTTTRILMRASLRSCTPAYHRAMISALSAMYSTRSLFYSMNL